jgi:predicted transposase YdaD
MYKGRLSPNELKTLTESLKKGEQHTMKHGLAAWRDELIEETTITVAHREDVKIAKYLKTKGMNINEIAEATGLTIDEILQL